MEPKVKLIASNDPALFEERLQRFLDSLSHDDVVVDVAFSTSPAGAGVEYAALVRYQETQGWEE